MELQLIFNILLPKYSPRKIIQQQKLLLTVINVKHLTSKIQITRKILFRWNFKYINHYIFINFSGSQNATW